MTEETTGVWIDSDAVTAAASRLATETAWSGITVQSANPSIGEYPADWYLTTVHASLVNLPEQYAGELRKFADATLRLVADVEWADRVDDTAGVPDWY